MSLVFSLDAKTPQKKKARQTQYQVESKSANYFNTSTWTPPKKRQQSAVANFLKKWYGFLCFPDTWSFIAFLMFPHTWYVSGISCPSSLTHMPYLRSPCKLAVNTPNPRKAISYYSPSGIWSARASLQKGIFHQAATLVSRPLPHTLSQGGWYNSACSSWRGR